MDDLHGDLMGGQWFARQSLPLRAALVRAARVVRLDAGQWVYSEGDEDTGLVGVIHGALRLEASVGSERDVLVGMALPGSFLGQSRRRGGGPRIISVRAGAATQVVLIADSALERIAGDLPELWRAVSELVYGQLDASVHIAAQLIALPPRGRIAARLLGLAVDGVVRVSQADLAEMCGLSRKSANAHLQALAQAGVVEPGYGEIRIIDGNTLARIGA